jgi:hypothetical protein
VQGLDEWDKMNLVICRASRKLIVSASVYMALADYVDRGHEHDAAHRGDQCQDMQKNS